MAIARLVELWNQDTNHRKGSVILFEIGGVSLTGKSRNACAGGGCVYRGSIGALFGLYRVSAGPKQSGDTLIFVCNWL